MHKLLKVFVSGLLSVLFAVSAYGASDMAIVIGQDGNVAPNPIKDQVERPVTVAYSLLKAGMNIDMNDTKLSRGDRQIAFYTDALRDDDRVTFSVRCEGAIKAGTGIHLLAWDETTNGWIRVGTASSTGNNDADGNYKSFVVRMQESGLTADSSLKKYDATFTGAIGAGIDIPAGTLLVLSESAATHDPITFVPKKGMPIGCSVKLNIDSITDYAKTLSMSKPDPITVIESICGLSADVWHNGDGGVGAVEGFATSEINVSEAAQRKSFINEPLPQDTNTSFSQFVIMVTEKAELGIDINDTAEDKFTLCLQRENRNGVEEVVLWDNLVNAPIECPWNTEVKGYVCDKMSLQSYVFSWSDDADDNPRKYIYVSIIVNQEEALSPGMWKASFKVYPDEINGEEITLLSCADAAYWFLDGVQFIVPYLYMNADYGTYIVLTNIGETAADIYMDVVSDQGKNEGAEGELYDNIKLAPIPARSTKTYFPATSSADIGMKEAILRDYPAFKGNRFLGKFTAVGAQPSNIQAAAFQKDGPGTTSKRSIPVLFSGGGQGVNADDKHNTFRE